MTKTRGRILKYFDKDGNIQKGIARDVNQHAQIQKARKFHLELVNDDFTPKMVDSKQKVTLKDAWRCQLIGYVD